MDNKKVLGISIVAVLVLVIAIVATSYATFTANLTGDKENKISTGYVKMNCAETTFNVQDVKPMTDQEGIAASDNVSKCVLTSEMNGTMTVGYDIALYDVDTVSPTDSIGVENVKIRVSKSVDSGAVQYITPSTDSSGALVSAFENNAGQYDKSIIAYTLDSAQLTGSHSVDYSIKAWVASEGAGSASSSTSTAEECSDSAYITKSSCQSAGEIWGSSKTQTQAGGSFSFKLKVGATQVLSE